MMRVPIQTIHLFQPLENKLIELLKSLSSDDWNKPTLARLWTVKDVAAHLLDTQLRGLAQANSYRGDPPLGINSLVELITYLNQLNADWVKAMKRIAPETLITLLEATQNQYIAYLQSLHPFDWAPFSVAWAGEEKSYNWFHIAREYTERWHHQQQIREAVNQSGILTNEFFKPMIQTLMMALPHTYRNCKTNAGEIVEVIVTGNEGGTWKIQFDGQQWRFLESAEKKPATTISMSADTSWKLFTKALDKETIVQKIHITGIKELGQPIYGMISIMG